MADYTPTSVKDFRQKKGSLAEKITNEFTSVQTAMNSVVKVVKGDLTAGAANAFAFAWQNPEESKILVQQVIVDVTTAGGTASSVLDVGVASGATGTADTILDGIDLNSASVYSSLSATVSGTNATENVHKVDENGGTNDYITGKILVEAASSLVGKYYIFYVTV